MAAVPGISLQPAATPTAPTDLVYALHDFVRENIDELSFSAGEAIVVLERDDQYGDGWYQGRNTLGEVGLFPQSYTSPTPPVDSAPVSPSLGSSALVSSPNPVMDATMIDVQNALDQLKVDRDSRADSASVRSHLSGNTRDGRNSDDEDNLPVENPRAVLAAKAAANAEKAAREQRERAESRRVEDGKAYASRGEMANGIQLSDESDDEDASIQARLAGDGAAAETRFVPVTGGMASSQTNGRPRAGTTTSMYSSESSASSPPPVPTAPLPSLPFPTSQRSPEVTPTPSSGRPFGLDNTALAATAGAGLAAAAAIGVATSNQSGYESARPASNVSTLAAQQQRVDLRTPTPTLPASQSLRNTPKDSTNPRYLNEMVDSPAASNTSATHSRSSSRLGEAPPTARSSGTGDTSPRESSYGNAALLKDLPRDPTTWGVDEVCEWGKAKGFDALTLSKFQEHEVSGDILLEMDVAMLKEIDLAAFGRRVHIYNAIKELRARVPQPSAGIPVSPGLSGYEPDSPGPMSFASPYAISQSSDTGDEKTRRLSDPGNGTGLGLGEEETAVQRSMSLAGVFTAVNASRARGGKSTHNRNATVDSSSTADAVESPILEESGEDDDSGAGRSQYPSSTVFPTRRGGDRSAAMTPASNSRSDVDDATIPGSPGPKLKSERSFFGATLGRNRKPPPRVPSSMDLGSSSMTSSSTLSRLSANTRRGTRLFAFGSDKSPEPQRTQSFSNISAPRDGPSSMSPKIVGEATAEMQRVQPDEVTSGNLLEKIGTPDHSGWMRKKGEKYNTWKQRYFVLKGIHLYYLKTENEQKAKGFINLEGYRVLADADIHVGEFGFKIVHDIERTHYFSAAEQVTVRTWMKEIMKATIGRDYSATVVSSCNVDTMSLAVAQAMTPRPRPPSPTSRARVQKERYAGSSPHTLTPEDAQKLMEFSPKSPITAGSRLSRRSLYQSQDGLASKSSASLRPISLRRTQSHSSIGESAAASTDAPSPLLNWVNANLPQGTAKADDLSSSLRSGRVLVRLVEKLSEKNSGISDADFAKYRVAEDASFSSDYFDTVFSTFDFLTPLVSTDEISMDDMLSGNQPQMEVLLRRIQAKYP